MDRNDTFWISLCCFTVALALLITLFLSGCATWKTTTRQALHTAHETAKTASAAVEPYYGDKCRTIARACAKVDDPVCTNLIKCQVERRKIILLIQAAHYAILDGMLAVEVAAEKDAQAALSKAIKLMIEIRGQLRELGIWKR